MKSRYFGRYHEIPVLSVIDYCKNDFDFNNDLVDQGYRSSFLQGRCQVLGYRRWVRIISAFNHLIEYPLDKEFRDFGHRTKTTGTLVGFKGEMARLLVDYRQLSKINLEDIIEFHYKFETIHPFQDGNGRVGRMIMFKECLKHNIVPFIIDEQNKIFYYRGLKEFGTKKGYLIDTCLSAQDRYQALIDYFNRH